MSTRLGRPGMLWAAAGIGGGVALYSLVQKAREMRLAGKVVLITGGTRGLGLQLAREFVGEGCHVGVCARGEQELRRAQEELQSCSSARVLASQVDVTRQHEVENWIRDASNYFGRVDVLVNNAGTIQVGPVENMELGDFQEAMDAIFYGTLYPTVEVLRQMRNRREGAIINVTSIGGKVAVPHLLPYCCAKFAATALSEGLHAELKQSGIHVMTVVPGLLRTGSYVNAEFRGKLEAELAWFANGEMSPLVAMKPEQAARQILRGLKRRQAEVVLTANAQLAARVHGAFPGLTAEALSLIARFLPGPGDGPKTTGRDIQRDAGSPLVAGLDSSRRETARKFHQPA